MFSEYTTFSAKVKIPRHWRIWWARGTYLRAKTLHFHAVFRKNWSNSMLTLPPGLAHPPLGNPGSTTASLSTWFGKSLDEDLFHIQGVYFLYCSLIDGIIDDYDVYKVETIGDGYMIASGLPKRNGNDHAVQIALSALHIVHVVSHYSFPHVTENGLQIRVGLHSGNFKENWFIGIHLSFCSG